MDMQRGKRLQHEQINHVGNSVLLRSNHLKVKQDKGLLYFDICGNRICCESSICVLNGGDGMSEQELFARVGLFVIAFGAYAFGTLFFSLAITHDIDDWSVTFLLAWFFGAIAFVITVMMLKRVTG